MGKNGFIVKQSSGIVALRYIFSILILFLIFKGSAVRAQYCNIELPSSVIADKVFQEADKIRSNGVTTIFIWCAYGENINDDSSRIVWRNKEKLFYYPDSSYIILDDAYHVDTSGMIKRFYNGANFQDTLFRLLNFYGDANIFSPHLKTIQRPFYYIEYHHGDSISCAVISKSERSVSKGDAAYFAQGTSALTPKSEFTQRRPFPKGEFQSYFINGPVFKMNAINHFSIEAGACFTQILEKCWTDYEVTMVGQFSKEKLYGLSADANLNIVLVNTGINFTWLTDFDHSIYLVRPEFGFHIQALDISYGYNFALPNKASEIISFPTHQVSLAFRAGIWWNYIISYD